MSHRFDGGCMDPKYGGEAGSEPPHVAQQSRRDKLRVQGGQQFGHDANPNPSHDFIYSSASAAAAGMLDFAAGPAANEANNSFLGGAGSCDWFVNCVSNSTSAAGPSSMYGDYTNFSHHNLHFSPSPSSYHNTLHEVVAPSSSSPGLEMMGGLSLPPMPWQLFQQQQQQYQEFPIRNMSKVAAEGGFGGDRYQNNQGLSLSLSSNPTPPQLCGVIEDVRGHGVVVTGSTSLDPRKVLSSTTATGGPLGPFTGYATILKSSKFLKPAQQLLDEFCSVVTGSSGDINCYRAAAEERGESSGGISASMSSSAGLNIGDGRGMSSSSFYSSTEAGSSSGQYQAGGVNCDQVNIPLPEIQQKKVKLLYLQDEVCRRYKQYHQQMQMVVSSFESVAGISAATPYTSLAVKSVSKHFRCLKNAISDQLRQVSKLVGEELMSSPNSASRGETAMTPARLKYVDQGFRKHRGGENSSLGFMENNQPVWRPQRGLPERAVAVLRAWLFEHFLHPYPTDTDKHMLATQTGLSRNQVSNWFINARVRLWKPMVEEIHSLESKGMAEMDLNSSNKKDGKAVMDDNGTGRPYHDQLSEAQQNKSLDCASMGGPIVNESSSIDMEQWHREKRTRMEECAIPQNMDAGLMSFAYQGGMELGGLGAVSLTLGLRHSEDPHQQQQQQQMRHFGSQMLHDFVG